MNGDQNNQGDEGNGPIKPTPKPRKKKINPYADQPYEVGKGKPPVATQFPKGGPSPNNEGRPKGSTTGKSFDRLLDRKVMVGHKNGREVRKTLREVVDHKLVEKAAGGDLKAIKILKDYTFQYEKLAVSRGPSGAELLEMEKEQREKELAAKKISAGIIAWLDMLAAVKYYGITVTVNGEVTLAPWVFEEAHRRKEEQQEKLKNSIRKS